MATREARVPLALKRISSSLDKKVQELYKISGGGGCLNLEMFIEKILYYGCQRYEYDILPVEYKNHPEISNAKSLIEVSAPSGVTIRCPERFKSKSLSA